MQTNISLIWYLRQFPELREHVSQPSSSTTVTTLVVVILARSKFIETGSPLAGEPKHCLARTIIQGKCFEVTK